MHANAMGQWHFYDWRCELKGMGENFLSLHANSNVYTHADISPACIEYRLSPLYSQLIAYNHLTRLSWPNSLFHSLWTIRRRRRYGEREIWWAASTDIGSAELLLSFFFTQSTQFRIHCYFKEEEAREEIAIDKSSNIFKLLPVRQSVTGTDECCTSNNKNLNAKLIA